MTTPTTPILSSSTHNDNTYNDMATPNGIAHSPSPSPYLPPQSLVPSPTFPPSSANSGNTIFSRGGSRRGSTSGSAKETDGEASPTRVNDTGSLSGRPSRRIPAPLKLFWGSSGSGSSNGSGSGSTGEDRIVLPERQPSPLRSVVRVDAFGREGEDEEEREEIRRRLTPLMGSASTRPSLEESAATSTSVRPSFESGRPSMDSYAGSSSVSLRRSPEPGYIREGSVSRPPTRLRESDPEAMRSRKRSMSVQGGLGGEFGVATNGSRGGSGSVVAGGSGNMSSAALSARERLARVRYGDLGGGTRPWSSLSMRSARTDNTSASLGVKSHGRSNRITAGSMEYDRERSPVLGGIERSISERTGEREMVQYRERSGSVSGVGTLGRYASLRTASEYNFTGNHSSVNLSMQHQTQHQPHPRAYSRMALSESSGGSGGHGRRGSGTFSSIGHGLMESPTLTVSTSASGSRDTPRSSSTGATSVSQVSAKEREREREELKELREKHAVETGALLNALSDSQRTCRVLREENGDLRERVAEVERENERLVRDLGELEREVERLRFSRERERVWERERLREREWDREREVGRGLSVSAGPGASGWRATATPLAKQRDVALGNRTMPRLNRWQGFERDPEHYDDLESTMKHTRSKLDNVLFPGEDELEPSFDDRHSLHEEDLVMQVEQKDEEDALSSTSTPAAPHRRRLSTSSSIFPIPPPNMTMLLHDETSMFPGTNRDSADVASLSGFKLSMSPVLPIPRVLKERHAMNNSVSSNISVSPPENFSMVTGSPGSLFLKPEHEMMLDEMESLDLGRSDKNEAEVWNE
ncbi:hypothetical protein P691DRAFT_456244 [Macrolepiota fuliginosa MF-IS2]|uniref:Uncharacterized protein n=1 Tax=Macrolepiota fuliginosa MF-IS2 TaxID=1400762 RepID=A0A9P6BYU8_9AGAR|nr:hypothetical protein P691DRAFT_456244 [Macrolepiota fuliginosa MF-IS2]